MVLVPAYFTILSNKYREPGLDLPDATPTPRTDRPVEKAYSAEKAASFAYQGHAASVKDPIEKAAIRQIELDDGTTGRKCCS